MSYVFPVFTTCRFREHPKNTRHVFSMIFDRMLSIQRRIPAVISNLNWPVNIAAIPALVQPFSETVSLNPCSYLWRLVDSCCGLRCIGKSTTAQLGPEMIYFIQFPKQIHENTREIHFTIDPENNQVAGRSALNRAASLSSSSPIFSFCARSGTPAKSLEARSCCSSILASSAVCFIKASTSSCGVETAVVFDIVSSMYEVCTSRSANCDSNLSITRDICK